MEVERKQIHQHLNSDYFWMVYGHRVHFYSLLCVYLLVFILNRKRALLTDSTSPTTTLLPTLNRLQAQVTTSMQHLLRFLPTQVTLPHLPLPVCGSFYRLAAM